MRSKETKSDISRGHEVLREQDKMEPSERFRNEISLQLLINAS